MKTAVESAKKPKFNLTTIFALLLCLLLLTASGCSFSINDGSSAKIESTQAALGVQETQISQKVNENIQATLAAQQAVIDAQVAQQQAADLASAQIALAVQATLAAAQPAPAVEIQPAAVVLPTDAIQPAAVPTVQLPAAPPPVELPPAVDMDLLMKSANIVIYEDMVNDTKTTPYVKRTMDKMGLLYKNDGSAKGWLKNDLLAGAKGGVPWDLVVLAVEYRGGISGEYFDYVNDVLNRGSSVIIEAYHLDQVSQGTVSTILARCGINIKNYVGKTQTLTDMVVWPISNISHPILNEPNSGLSFTKAVYYWPYSDLGDLVSLTGSGDAQIILGRNADERTSGGVLTTCLGGQLTLLTTSSHNYSFQTIMPLWENMIYQALKYRFTNN